MRVLSLATGEQLLGITRAMFLLCAAACSAAPDDSSASALTDGSGGAPVIDLGLVQGDARRDTPLGPGEACATGIAESQPLPAIVQMVVDTSGSMAWPPGWQPETHREPPRSVESKWDITRRALTAAVDDLPAATLLGVNFYPNVAHGSRSCVNNELALAIAPLGADHSPQRRRFDAKLAAVEPRGGTPTHAAYRFGVETLGARTLTGNGFVLLITDGVPTYTATCSGDGRDAVDSAPLIAEAAKARKERGIRTFVIGSPGSEGARAALSRVAEAGGTGAPGCSHEGPRYCHFDMTRSTDLGAALERALADISAELVSCEYTIPAPPAGRSFDPERVNVLHTSSDGDTELLLRDESAACSEGWTYSSDRRRIVLCPTTCDAVRAAQGRIDVLFGCMSEVRAPR